jgi:GNAT superfamily N-acetyltransferase
MAPSPEQLFNYNLYTASDADEMARLLGEVFAESDPPAGAVGLTPFEFEAFVRLFCAKAKTERLTIVARSAETGEMIGALLTKDLASAPPEGIDLLSAKFDPIFDILRQLDADYRGGQTVRSGELLHLFLLGVAQRFVGQGVAQQLVAECLANGASRGYRVAVTKATNKTSRHIFRKQGFVKRVRRSYRDHTFNGQAVFASIAEHGGPILMDKRLPPPPKSLADILAEELVGKLGEECTQELSVPEKQKRLQAVYERIHKEQPTRSALCLSGGGIRSATFGLGILQGLARCGLLDKFHYLSTVSGGGYIGSWLSAWIKNHPQGIDGVVKELSKSCSTVSVKDPHDSPLNPDPRPIRHLRKFSNYLAPKTGLTSVDFWTLITTFIRNMFLNWLVLISLLGAVMMIPRFYLVAITLQPDWANWDSVKHQWDMGLTILLAVGFALVAIAMAYAIIDVPSTGKARFFLSQRRFLIYRQLPLFLASLILAGWWAVFRNVHGSEPFQPGKWLFKFIGFSVACYLSGGLIAGGILLFRKRKEKAGPTRLIDWLRRHIRSPLRTGTIVLTAAFAGFCLWAMATRLFLGSSGREFELKSECEAILIPSLQEVRLSAGTQVQKILGKGGASLKNKYTFTREWDANQIPSGQNMKIQRGDHALFATEDLDALKPMPVSAPAKHALNYVCFAPALILVILLVVNFLFTGLASWVTEDEDREWWGRSAAWILITIVGWMVFNVMDLWGAQAIRTTPNQLQVFVDPARVTGFPKAILGAFGGVTGIAGALLALRHKLSNTLGQKRGFRWLLVAVAVVFFFVL